MKRILVAVLACLSLALAVAAAPASAHYYSWNSGISDARYGIILLCGGQHTTCYQRNEPTIYHCGEHSWCWSFGYSHLEGNWWTPWSKLWYGSSGQAAHGTLINYAEWR